MACHTISSSDQVPPTFWFFAFLHNAETRRKFFFNFANVFDLQKHVVMMVVLFDLFEAVIARLFYFAFTDFLLV